jgi:hypothetical protein
MRENHAGELWEERLDLKEFVNGRWSGKMITTVYHVLIIAPDSQRFKSLYRAHAIGTDFDGFTHIMFGCDEDDVIDIGVLSAKTYSGTRGVSTMRRLV